LTSPQRQQGHPLLTLRAGKPDNGHVSIQKPQCSINGHLGEMRVIEFSLTP
jgi:hypothetical protein